MVLNSYELANETCDEKKFFKSLAGPLVQTRNGLADGLFTVRHPLLRSLLYPMALT